MPGPTLLVSFPRRGLHVRCLCHLKHSIMPSFFLCAFYENLSLLFPLAPHSTGSGSGLQTPRFLSCVLLGTPVQPSHYVKCSGSYCGSQIYKTFLLQTFGPLLWPVLTGLDFFTGLLPKIWEQVHSFSARYSSDWSLLENRM